MILKRVGQTFPMGCLYNNFGPLILDPNSNNWTIYSQVNLCHVFTLILKPITTLQIKIQLYQTFLSLQIMNIVAEALLLRLIQNIGITKYILICLYSH